MSEDIYLFDPKDIPEIHQTMIATRAAEGYQPYADPDIADAMGAFTEDALSDADADDSHFELFDLLGDD